jgi:hypothetical protein
MPAAVAAAGAWPELLDDTALWRPARPEPDPLASGRLDDEQRGRRWNG